MEVTVPAVNVAMSTTEYAFICAVLGENFREAPALPPPVGGACEDAGAAGAGATAVAPQADAVAKDAAAAAAQVAEVAAAAAAAPYGSADAHEQLRFRLALQLHDVSCMLYDGAGRNRPLAEARIVGGWAGISTSVHGVMRVSVAVRDLTIADARVTTPSDRRAVLGVDTTSGYAAPAAPHASSSGALAPMTESGAPQAALLMLDYSFNTQDGTFIGVRLQRPSLAVDIGFLLAVGRFFVPSLAGGTAEALDAVLPNDLVLLPGGDAGATVAKRDTLLTPRRRMLADAPADGAELSYVFDGGGHALVLPPAPERRVGGPSGAVVLVGPGRTLTLRNARLVRAERLEEAVQLAPGARLIMDPSLKMVYGGEEDEALATPSPPRRPSSPEPALRPAASAAAAAAAAAAAPPKVAYALALNLDIVGLQLRFVEMLKQGDAEASAGGDAAAASAAKPRGEQAGWLRTRAGAEVEYKRSASGATVQAWLRGLLIEAHLPGAVASLPLLAPTDVALSYTSDPGAAARVGVTTSAIDLRLSPRLLSLVNRLSAGAAAVFSHAPTRVSTSFQLLWTAPPPPPPRGTSAAGFLRADAADAVSRLCLWRPVAPPGYASLGDALTSGTAPPTVAALVMRDSGALCLPPLGYAKRLALPGGVTLWEPQPPPGCVAAGCVAALGSAPPSVSAVRCPRAALVVEALPLECMHCDDAGAVWRVGNAAGTAVFAVGCVRCAWSACFARHRSAIHPSDACIPPMLSPPVRARHAQLRACCGTCASRWAWMFRTPQPLRCHRLLQPPQPSKRAARRRKRRCAAGPGRLAPRAPSWSSARCVQRALQCYGMLVSCLPGQPLTLSTSHPCAQIWSSYNLHQKEHDISLWRPLAPPGYYAVGDCAVSGFRAPQRALVVRDDGDGALAPPTSYVQVYRDSGSRMRKPEYKEGTLALWRPVPPPGYVAMGCVATPNHRTPGADAVRCVRRDLVSETKSPNMCFWTTAGAERKLGTQLRASVWPLDTSTCAFWACEPPPGTPPNAHLGTKAELANTEFFELVSPDGSTRGGAGIASFAAGAGDTAISIRLGDVGALFFYVASSGRPLPLLDLTLRKCRPDIVLRPGGTSVKVECEVGAEVYNSRVDAWEPVVEPWPLEVKYDSRAANGGCQGWRAAGGQLVVASSKELRCCVSHALADTLLAYRADAGGAAGGEAPAGHAGARTAPLCNVLGTQLFVRSGAGGRVTGLMPGDALPVPLPAPAALSRHALAQSEPRRTVVVDILASRREAPHGGGAAAPAASAAAAHSRGAVYVKVTVRCRAVRAFSEVRTAPAALLADGSACWAEQLLVEVPAPRGAEGAEGELNISLEVCDAAVPVPPPLRTGLTPTNRSSAAAAAKALAAATPLGTVTLRGVGAARPPAWLDLGNGVAVRAAFRVVEAATTFSDPFAPDAGVDTAAVAAGCDPLVRTASAARALEARSLEFTTAIEFEAIWDTSDTGASRIASVWRPILPPGCLSLGDCMVPGAAPPRGVLVLRDDGSDASAPPTRFDSVFHDSGPGAKGASGGRGGTLGVWRPVPPPGYVALGCVVTCDHAAPPVTAVRCLRADLAHRADVPPLPTWESTGAAARLGPLQLSCWRLDERTGAFWAEPDLRRTTLLAAPLWRLPDSAAHTVDLQRSRGSMTQLGGLGSRSSTGNLAGAAAADPTLRVEVALQPEGPWGRLWRTGGAAAEGVTAVPLGDGTFALVDRAGAAAAARMRAPAELRNATGVPIEVRLRPRVAPPEASVVVEEVFENERLIPIRGWGTPPLSAVGKFKCALGCVCFRLRLCWLTHAQRSLCVLCAFAGAASAPAAAAKTATSSHRSRRRRCVLRICSHA
jgi:hypothetical protein